MTKVFIDGSAGTTGLRIADRLAGRADLQILTLTGDARKDPAARKEALFASDIAFLCLPDAAAKEAVVRGQFILCHPTQKPGAKCRTSHTQWMESTNYPMSV